MIEEKGVRECRRTQVAHKVREIEGGNDDRLCRHLLSQTVKFESFITAGTTML
jgi:hypothetical protein